MKCLITNITWHYVHNLLYILQLELPVDLSPLPLTPPLGSDATLELIGFVLNYRMMQMDDGQEYHK